MRKPKSDWTDIFLAFRLVLEPRKLWLAFKGIVLSTVLIALLLAVLAVIYHGFGLPPYATAPPAGPGERLPAVASAPAGADADVWGAIRQGRLGGAVLATRQFAEEMWGRAFAIVAAARVRSQTDFYAAAADVWGSRDLVSAKVAGLLVTVVLLLIWSYYGPAILRLAAAEYALGERLELKSVAAYTWRKHHCFYGPPLGLAAAIVLVELGILVVGLTGWNILAFVLALAGLAGAGVAASVARDRLRSVWAGLGVGAGALVVLAAVLYAVSALGWRIPYVGELVLGLLSPLALGAGFLCVLMGIWLACGLPLMAGTVSTSDTGTFDAWSRSFHYLFVHPWRYAFYLLVAAAYGVACLAFVHLVRVGTEWATLLPLSVGPVLAGEAASEPLLGFFVWADRLVLDLVFLSFVVAYAFSAMAIVYLLLRHHADGTPISEVHLEKRDLERISPPSEPPPS